MEAGESIIRTAVARKTSKVTRSVLNGDRGVFLAFYVLRVWINDQADAAVRTKFKSLRTTLRMSRRGTRVERRHRHGSRWSCQAVEEALLLREGQPRVSFRA